MSKTQSLQFVRHPHPSPVAADQRSASLLAALGDAFDALQAFHVIAGIRPRLGTSQQGDDSVADGDVVECGVTS